MTNPGEPNTARRRATPKSGYRLGRLDGPVALVASAVALGGLLYALPAPAMDFGEGEIRGSLDTTISHGMTFRVEDRNSELAADTNGNDGDLNYDRGIVSNTSKFTTDFDIGFGKFGAFVRTTGFIDFENQDGERGHIALSDEAKERVGRNVELLDAYVTGTFDAADTTVDVRLGRHVLNWGESTFIPNGINAINPIDVSKLRLPGSELREALLPAGLASVSVSPTDTLSVEGFYQFDWEETHIDPVGSYFSSTDYAGPGARKAVIDTVTGGRDDGHPFGPLVAAIDADLARLGSTMPIASDTDFASVLRGPDRTPDASGQWGAALRYLAEDLNHTEFGLYFINYHSRLPTIGARTAGREIVQAGLGAAAAVGNPSSATATAITHAVAEQVGRGVAAGAIPPEAARAAIASGVADQIAQIAGALAIDRYAKSGRYFLEYPEDLQLFGLSFNTALGTSGWALQGEYSLRPNAPLQRAERSVLEEGLQPIITALGLSGCAQNPAGANCPRAPDGSLLPPQAFNGLLQQHLAGTVPGSVQGYVERNVSQAQATATRVFGPMLGADALAFITEVAVMHVHGMPDKNANPLESPAGGILATGDADADATSWGYRLAARLDYSNAIGAVNLYPYAQFLHDVSGNSPAPSGPFVEGRTAITLGVRAGYLSRWQADLAYTRYAGDGNELSDRDFISASVKYSF